MTDTTITPVVAPEAPPDTTPPAASPAPAAAVEVDHTPGGWPVVPLAVTGTNATTSLMAAAALAGGPAALALAATGAVVIGATATARNRRDQRRNAGGRASTKAANEAGSSRGATAGRVPKQSRPGSLGKTSTATGVGSRRGNSNRAAASSPRSSAAGAALRKRGTTTSRTRSASPAGTAGKAGGRVGQVKALRESQRQTSPSRAARRAETTGARRAAADARRAAKSQARTASLARKGPIGRGVAKGLGKASKVRSKAVDRARAARDQRAAGEVAGQRSSVRKAPARKRARKALWRSAARFQGRRLLAALLAGALGIVGMVTTPLGRKLRIGFLQQPGRRLYARLMRVAGEQRAERDEEIRAARKDEEAAADAEAENSDDTAIGDRAERPSGVVPAAPDHTSTSEGEIVSGFNFEEHAAEMESAAQQYDPENAMEILAMVEGLPAALTSVANTMRVLAERSDSEFPLEKAVADGFNDIFGAVMSAVAVAEDMGPLFRQAHEQDIARHEDPRNGPEAEKGWNV